AGSYNPCKQREQSYRCQRPSEREPRGSTGVAERRAPGMAHAEPVQGCTPFGVSDTPVLPRGSTTRVREQPANFHKETTKKRAAIAALFQTQIQLITQV